MAYDGKTLKPGTLFMKYHQQQTAPLVSAILVLIIGPILGFLVAQEWYVPMAALAISVLALVLGNTSSKTQLQSYKTEEMWYKVAACAPPRRLVHRHQMTFGIFLSVSLLAVNLYAPAQPTPIERLLASLIILLASVPTFLWLSGRDRASAFLPLFGFIYSGLFALPIFVLEKYTRAWYVSRIIADGFVEKALLLSLIGLGVLFLGYYAFGQGFVIRVVPKANWQWQSLPHVKLVGGVLGIIGVSVYYADFFAQFPLSLQQLVRLLGDLSLVSIAILFSLQVVGCLGFIGKTFLWMFLVPTRVLLGLTTGMRSEGLEVVLLLIIVLMTLRRRIPWKPLIVGILLIFLLEPVKVQFRALDWGIGGKGKGSPSGKIFLYLGTARDTFFDKHFPSYEAFRAVTSRLSNLMIFAEVVEATPAYIPFWSGWTYYPLLFKPIPRLVYPNKPDESRALRFAHDYGFNRPDDTTFPNIPQVMEFYANFGTTGVWIGMFLLGIFYRIIQYIFVHREMGLGAVVGNVYISTKLLSISSMESPLSMVIGGVFWGLLFLGLIHLLLKVTERWRILKWA